MTILSDCDCSGLPQCKPTKATSADISTKRMWQVAQRVPKISEISSRLDPLRSILTTLLAVGNSSPGFHDPSGPLFVYLYSSVNPTGRSVSRDQIPSPA